MEVTVHVIRRLTSKFLGNRYRADGQDAAGKGIRRYRVQSEPTMATTRRANGF